MKSYMQVFLNAGDWLPVEEFAVLFSFCFVTFGSTNVPENWKQPKAECKKQGHVFLISLRLYWLPLVNFGKWEQICNRRLWQVGRSRRGCKDFQASGGLRGDVRGVLWNIHQLNEEGRGASPHPSRRITSEECSNSGFYRIKSTCSSSYIGFPAQGILEMSNRFKRSSITDQIKWKYLVWDRRGRSIQFSAWSDVLLLPATGCFGEVIYG